MKASTPVDLDIRDWNPTGDFDGADGRSRMSAPFPSLVVMGLPLHLEAWQVVEADEDDDADFDWDTANPGLRDDYSNAHAAFMQDGTFEPLEVQFSDEPEPRYYVVFAFPGSL